MTTRFTESLTKVVTGGKDSLDSLGNLKDFVEYMGEAGRIARDGLSDSARQDELIDERQA